jgi:hypothetical protein
VKGDLAAQRCGSGGIDVEIDYGSGSLRGRLFRRFRSPALHGKRSHSYNHREKQDSPRESPTSLHASPSCHALSLIVVLGAPVFWIKQKLIHKRMPIV